MSHPDLRSRDELLDYLEQRRRAFQQLPHTQQTDIDMTRFLPTNQMYRLLDHYLAHGHMADESECGQLLADKRAA